MRENPRPTDAFPSSSETGEIPVSRVSTLDGWLKHSWSDGVQVDELDDLQAVRVETMNSTYDLAIVSARTGEMLVRGGRYFPDWTTVQLLGCSLGGGLLKRYGVHVGFRMELYWAGRVVITSVIQAIGLAPAAYSDLARPEARQTPAPINSSP
jgi:hypothetical protein